MGSMVLWLGIKEQDYGGKLISYHSGATRQKILERQLGTVILWRFPN